MYLQRFSPIKYFMLLGGDSLLPSLTNLRIYLKVWIGLIFLMLMKIVDGYSRMCENVLLWIEILFTWQRWLLWGLLRFLLVDAKGSLATSRSPLQPWLVWCMIHPMMNWMNENKRQKKKKSQQNQSYYKEKKVNNCSYIERAGQRSSESNNGPPSTDQGP